MDLAVRQTIERDCERLMYQYCHYCDHDEAARIAELFTEDGEWHSPNLGVRMIGQNGIRKGFQRRQDNKGRMSRHVCTNPLVEVISETEAKGVVYMNLYYHDGDPDRETSPIESLQKLGEYRDKFVKTDLGWRFSRREVVANFLRSSD